MNLVRKLTKTVLLKDETGFMFHVPLDVYENEEIPESEYENHMIPYSLSFDLIINSIVSEVEIQQQLYAQGIHTLDDVLSNRKVVNDILKRNFNAERIIHEVRAN